MFWNSPPSPRVSEECGGFGVHRSPFLIVRSKRGTVSLSRLIAKQGHALCGAFVHFVRSGSWGSGGDAQGSKYEHLQCNTALTGARAVYFRD